jgi:hypothetical protein
MVFDKTIFDLAITAATAAVCACAAGAAAA